MAFIGIGFFDSAGFDSPPSCFPFSFSCTALKVCSLAATAVLTLPQAASAFAKFSLAAFLSWAAATPGGLYAPGAEKSLSPSAGTCSPLSRNSLHFFSA